MFADLPNLRQLLSQPTPPNRAGFDLLGQNASSEWRNRIRCFVVHLSQKHGRNFRNAACGSAGALEAPGFN